MKQFFTVTSLLDSSKEISSSSSIFIAGSFFNKVLHSSKDPYG